MTPRLSVVIPTQDNEDTLASVLESAAFADEIVVLDSGSTDRTVELARAAGARVLNRPYVSDGDQRNAGWNEARGAWILALDSDEVLDAEACDAIRRTAARDPGPGDPVAYSFRFRSYFLDHPIDHGGLDREGPVRLGFRERTRWESKLHSRMLADGRIEILPGTVHHYTGTSLLSRMRKIAAYAADRAETMRRAGRRPSVLLALWEPARFFFGRVVLRGGFRDGLPGIAWWWLQSTEILLAHLLLMPGTRDRSAGPRDGEQT
jgi:glycosyltransferase involved in cell wall biosynthesis